MVVCLKQEAAILSLFDISEVTQKNLTIQGHIAKDCFNFFLHITPPSLPQSNHTLQLGFEKYFRMIFSSTQIFRAAALFYS